MSDGRIEVGSFDSGVELTAAASLLRASGIEVEVIPRDPGGVRAFAGMAPPGRLLVAPGEVERAKELLAMAESGAYEEGLEEMPEVEAPPEVPATPGEIAQGLSSLRRLRIATNVSGFAFVVAVILTTAVSKTAALVVAGLALIAFWSIRFSLHFARCPRCRLRFHGNWTWTNRWPDACVNCGLKLLDR